MEPQNAYLVGLVLGITSMVVIQYMWKRINNKLETDGLDHNFPKVWNIQYNTLGRFSNVIYKLATTHILKRGNLADFIRTVPFNTDGWHVATITIQFGLVKKCFKNKTIDDKPYQHSIILVRKDIKHDGKY